MKYRSIVTGNEPVVKLPSGGRESLQTDTRKPKYFPNHSLGEVLARDGSYCCGARITPALYGQDKKIV